MSDQPLQENIVSMSKLFESFLSLSKEQFLAVRCRRERLLAAAPTFAEPRRGS